MTTTRTFAAAMIVAFALASCSGANYVGGSPDQSGFAPAEVDTNWIGAAILLALLVVFSTSN
jgi:hypothetical protein